METKDNTRNIKTGYLLFVTGLFIASLGVAFSTKAGLGTSPVSSVPYSISLVNGLFTFGGWLNVFSITQIVIQVMVMKGKCNYIEIVIQTALAFVYGYLTDMSCYLIRNISADTYPEQIFYLLLSCAILGFGIWIQLKGGVAMLPGEAMNRAISKAVGIKYGNVKIFFDILYIAISAVICLVFMGHLEGVREGSIIAAVLIGNIIKFYETIYRYIKKRLSAE